MKQHLRPKKEATSTVDALINDYTSNEDAFNAIVNNNQTLSHLFFEGIYLKYSYHLEQYMTKNKSAMRLSGSRKYMNVPIELFLKEAKQYKEEMINELKGRKIKNKREYSLTPLDKIFLTPLPDIPRVLLTTEKEKSDFQSAERFAVVMRTFEYTSALRNKGMALYYQMKNDERQQMIYIMRRAVDVIKKWWRQHLPQIRIKRKEREKRIIAIAKGLKILMDIFAGKLKGYFKITKNGLNEIKKEKMKFLGSLGFATIENEILGKDAQMGLCYTSQEKEEILLNKKMLCKGKHCYYSKKLCYNIDEDYLLSVLKNNKNIDISKLKGKFKCLEKILKDKALLKDIQDGNFDSIKNILHNEGILQSNTKSKGNNNSKNNTFLDKVIYIQQTYRKYKHKQQFNNNSTHTSKQKILISLFKLNRNKHKLLLIKYFFHWYRIMHSFTLNNNANVRAIVNSSKQNGSKTYLPTYISYLPIVLVSKFKGRFRDVFNALLHRKNLVKSFEYLNKTMDKLKKKKLISKLKHDFKMNALYRAIIHSDIQGKKWKNFQLWIMRNILIKIFWNKIKKYIYISTKAKVLFKYLKRGYQRKIQPPSDLINRINNNDNKIFDISYLTNTINKDNNFI